MSKEIEYAVSTLIEAAGVIVNVKLIGATMRDKWECDEWRVTFARGKALESFAYFTGTGHRKSKLAMPKEVARYPNTLHAEAWKRDNLKPVAPPVAGVIQSLILDSSASDQSFASWCADFGYEEDSRKALAMYEACQKEADKLSRIFSTTERDALAEALQDY